MAVTIDELFKPFDLNYLGPVKWGEKIDANFNGVYIISLSKTPKASKAHNRPLEIDEATFDRWLVEAEDLNVAGKKVTEIEEIRNHLEQFWNKDENILYIGESASPTNPLQKRIDQFYKHKVGKKGPHSGGYWLKLISNLLDVNIYYAECANPREVEFKLIMRFVELQHEKSFFEIDNFTSYFPFANLKVDVLKKHGVKKYMNNNTREIRKAKNTL